MNKDHKIILFIVAIPVMAILTIFTISKASFDLSLSPIERKIFYFNYGNVPKIAERSMIQTGSIKSPIALSKTSAKFPGTPLSEISPASPQTGKRVSMILVNKNKKIAVIDGKMLNEGDFVDKHRIARIEKDKVLLKNKEGEKWLKLE
jgi:hypothetical protein